MTYTHAAGAGVVRDADGAYIPADPGNSDWQAYQTWVAAGNTATLYAPPPPPPPTLTFLQFMALFSPAEQAAIVNATDTQTRLFLLMATGAGTLQLSDPNVIASVNYIATLPTATPPGPGLIAAARVAQILANESPPTL